MEIKQSETFARWLNRLPDRTARTMIAARITRLSEGLAGDVASVGGGAKSSQARDISVAQAMANSLE